jgi:hypothetical protein
MLLSPADERELTMRSAATLERIADLMPGGDVAERFLGVQHRRNGGHEEGC